MNRLARLAALLLLLVSGSAGAGELETARHGTLVEWWKRPKLAALAAEHQDKLLFVLEVAGDWEDPGRT